jgi:hypothetical protein
MASQLKAKLAQSLSEFKRDKVCRQNARLSLANSVYENPSLPRRKILLSTGSHNYRPPLERSKSAPKLMVIEESLEEGEEDCLDAPTYDFNVLYGDSSVLSRLEQMPAEKCQGQPEGTENMSQRCHDSSDERVRSESPACRGTSRTQSGLSDGDDGEQSDGLTCRGALKERGVVGGGVNDMSFDKCSRLGDTEVGNLEENGLSVFRFDENQDHVLHKETESSHCLPRFRGSGEEVQRRNVSWNLEARSTSEDGDSWRRNVSNYHTERLLVIGSCKHDVRRCIPLSGGVNEEQVMNSQGECESADEGSNSLQSISSSASCSSDNSSRVASDLKPLASYIHEDADIRAPEDEVEVDLHPTGESTDANLDQLSAQLRRSATFPPPSALIYANGGKNENAAHVCSKDLHNIT